MKKILSACQKAENMIILVTFVMMVVAAFAQVVNRNIFKLGIGWFEEVAVYSMIWMALLGTEMGLRDGTQASVTAVVDRFHGKAKEVIHIVSKILVVAFTAMITQSAWGMVAKQIQTGQTSPALHLPMSVPYAALLVSFAIMTAVQSVTVVTMLIGLFRTVPPIEPLTSKEGGDER